MTARVHRPPTASENTFPTTMEAGSTALKSAH